MPKKIIGPINGYGEDLEQFKAVLQSLNRDLQKQGKDTTLVQDIIQNLKKLLDQWNS